MADFDDKVRKIQRHQLDQARKFETHRAKLKGLEDAIRHSLAEVIQFYHPVSQEPLVRIDVVRELPDIYIAITAFDGKQVEFRLLTTGTMTVTAPTLSRSGECGCEMRSQACLGISPRTRSSLPGQSRATTMSSDVRGAKAAKAPGVLTMSHERTESHALAA
jgi:hypothetical protein